MSPALCYLSRRPVSTSVDRFLYKRRRPVGNLLQDVIDSPGGVAIFQKFSGVVTDPHLAAFAFPHERLERQVDGQCRCCRKECLQCAATTKEQELAGPYRGALCRGYGDIIYSSKYQETRFVFYCSFQSVGGLSDRILARDGDNTALGDSAGRSEGGEYESEGEKQDFHFVPPGTHHCKKYA